ncbi:hypothetical protein NDU88_005211 [Pleurodeles waltl]|uniref:Uncharacterized protein n=1 Tax=Pleurodeles waltl TaxID=8319 RepID=A0AAV7L8U2_PLEWA|nr:hypothetical protein NDU88_005211 [Pleurodeles waltl]
MRRREDAGPEPATCRKEDAGPEREETGTCRREDMGPEREERGMRRREEVGPEPKAEKEPNKAEPEDGGGRLLEVAWGAKGGRLRPDSHATLLDKRGKTRYGLSGTEP